MLAGPTTSTGVTKNEVTKETMILYEINHNLEDQKNLFCLHRVNKKMNIVKIRTNSHGLHSEKGCWTSPIMY